MRTYAPVKPESGAPGLPDVDRVPFHARRKECSCGRHRYACVALLTLLVLAAIISDCPGGRSSVAAQETTRISQRVLRQIEALNAEKDSRTPAQQKIDSQFLYALKRNRHELAAAFETMVSAAAIDANGRVLSIFLRR